MPDIEFRNSQNGEKVRYQQTYREVANGWFVNHGFLVFPTLRSDIQAQIQVIMPSELKYEKVDVLPFEREWKRVENAFWDELDHYLPEASRLHVGKMVVDVGKIGTISSSYWSAKHYYLRADRGVGDLAAMIVNHTMFEQRSQIGITWTKREALMDFIMTRSVMKKLFPEFSPVYAQLLQISPNIRRESEEYVRSMGIVNQQRKVETKNGKIFVRNECVETKLGKKEMMIWKALIKKKGELVSYDELADSIWGEGEFKSFWALAKLVERLRKFMESINLDPKYIESVRGQGYCWNCG